jgi:membrane glycosyltransferase
LPRDKSRKPGEVDPELAIARAKLADAENVEDASAFLNAREKFAVMNSRAGLEQLLELADV